MEIVILAVVVFVIFKFGIIRSLISWIKKADAATAVQNLLEHQKSMGLFDGTPASAATLYIQEAWESKPDVFDGRFGVRPHKLSVVVYSMALAVQRLYQQGNRNFAPVMIGLGSAISEIEVNGSYYPFAAIDHKLFQEAVEIIGPIMEREGNTPASTELTALLHGK